MNAGKNKYLFTVGIFTLLALAILTVAIWMLGGQHKSFEKKFPVKGIFEDVNGLKVGDNVWFSGVKIGIISSIALTDEGNVLITMSIEKKSRKYIHQDSKIKIGSDGLIGNKIVVIYGATKTSPLIADNDYLSGKDTPGTSAMLSVLDSSSRNLLQITNNLKEISNQILTGKGTLNTLLNDSTLSTQLKYTVSGARAAMADFSHTAAGSEEVMNNLVEFSNRLNKEGTLVNNLLSDTVSYNKVSGGISRLEAAIDTLSRFSDNLKKASDALNKNNNNVVNSLLYDATTANQLKSTISNLDSASDKLKVDLEAVRHNFLLRGYFKKKKQDSH